jgi:predicted ATPase/class 3 adenylate cyclase
MLDVASRSSDPGRPSGTVTFLFTDIEGSTRLWEQYPEKMKAAHHRQEAILLEAIEAHGGYAYKMIGDAFQAAFHTAPQALEAALDAQRALHSEPWEKIGIGDLRVRMGIHTGITEEREGDYTGPVLNRVARLMSAGHGGQILISLATQELVRDHLPSGVTLLDLGEHRLKDLTRPERIFQLIAEGMPSQFPTLKTLDNRPNNLPLQPNPLIGREKEVEDVRGMLQRDDVRLLTLTGPGGIGKTRLALQAVAEMVDDFPDGVFFVNLAPLVDPGLVVPTIAYTLGLREAGDQPIADILKDYLKYKWLVMVLDNFEQVLEAAPQISELLKTAAHLKMLVTSRTPLNLSMEHQYAVPPLAVPDLRQQHGPEALSQYDAVTLFIQRAEAVKPGFRVNNANAPAVAEICYRLEGIPLAIELAAARVKVLSPQALLDRLGSRLKLLTGGARDVPARQQTLRNTIEWGYDLLTGGEKQLFRRASVFRGGRTLEAVEEVCNAVGDLEVDVLDGVTSLVDKSLMYTVEGKGGEARYWMLETIYEHAIEKLDESGEGEEIRRQHALYFMKLGERAEPELRGAQQGEWLGRLEDEHDNIRAVLRRGMESSGAVSNPEAVEALEIGLQLAGALWRFWYVRGHFSEGREWMTGLLGLSRLMASPELPGVRDGGTAESQPALVTYRARALHGAGVLADMQGDYAYARSLHEESLALRRELEDKSGIADSLNNLGIVADMQGDYAYARSLYEESLALRRELEDKWGIAGSLGNLGGLAYSQGDYATARSLQEESLALRRELEDKGGIAGSLARLGGVEVGTGGVERGVRLLAAVQALLEEIGAVFDRGDRIPYERAIASAREELGDEVFERVWEEGRAMPMEQAIAYALQTPIVE